ncbi:hypothetical protein Pfo_018290 [Paulownia fortunei]|nr:hypothetical protein Pfo_018290 [Paulownia fortunei]
MMIDPLLSGKDDIDLGRDLRLPSRRKSLLMLISFRKSKRFTLSRLAQLKLILPKAVEIRKVLQYDERTSCMKPDLLVTLNIEAIETQRKSSSCSRNVQLMGNSFLTGFWTSSISPGGACSKCISSVLTFSSSPAYIHLAIHRNFLGSEVSEKAIPEPFSQLKGDAGQPAIALHLSPSFRRCFSQRVITGHASVDSEPKFAESPSEKEISAFAARSPSILSLKQTNKVKCYGACSAYVPPSPLPETPAKMKLMSATPMLQPPKRCYMSLTDELSGLLSKLVRRPPPNRPLNSTLL